MMTTIRAWAVRLGLWLARWGGAVGLDRWHVPATIAPLVDEARWLALDQDAHAAEGTSGEYKRHQVYSRLIKAHPEIQKRDLALAIELAVR